MYLFRLITYTMFINSKLNVFLNLKKKRYCCLCLFHELVLLKKQFLIKKVSIYLFVLLYIVAMLRPIAPLVEYVINYDYISKVLCINKDKPELSCNGKCHLMKKLAQQQEDDFNSLRINMKEYPVGFVSLLEFSSNKSEINIKRKNLFSYKQDYDFAFYQKIFHPPII